MPQTPLKILGHLRKGELEMAARAVEKEAIAIYDLRAKRPGYVVTVIKEAINLCGLNVGPVRPPLAPMQDADRRELRALLEKLGLIKSQVLGVRRQVCAGSAAAGVDRSRINTSKCVYANHD